MRVLVCEDDRRLRKGLVELLLKEGFDSIEAENGREALQLFKEERPDFVCLDIITPEVNGYDVCREIRSTGSKTPILFISAKSSELDRVLGLELGGDDYLVKPFGMSEFVSRIRAISRRCATSSDVKDAEILDAPNKTFSFGDYRIEPEELRAYHANKCLELNVRELRILQLLWRERGNVVSRESFYNHCWGMRHLPSSRTVDQQISRLRKKLKDQITGLSPIETVHGAGYRYI